MLTAAGHDPREASGVIVSTVVPQLALAYEQMAARYLKAPLLIVGTDLRSGMAIRIDNPRELGSDRLVNAIAAYERFGSACVSVDFGTSINFDAVSDDAQPRHALGRHGVRPVKAMRRVCSSASGGTSTRGPKCPLASADGVPRICWIWTASAPRYPLGQVGEQGSTFWLRARPKRLTSRLPTPWLWQC